LDSVVFHFLAGYPLDMYETDDIDVAGVSVSYIDRVTDEAGPFYSQLMIVPELSLGYIGFNAASPPFDDVNVRRAFTQAVDREKLATLVYRDMVQAADGILPPGLPGHDEGLSGLEFDVEKARESIRASRYGDVSALPPITLTTSGWGGLVSGDLEAIISEWRQNLGVEVKVRQLEPQRYLYHLREELDEMYYLGWVADYPHPQNFLEVLFHSQAQYNYGQYFDAEVDALLYEAGTEQDNLRSLDLYQQVERILVEDAACLPLWFGQNYVLVKSRVRGYSLNPMGFASLNMVSVEGE
jgi:oligopeptide transport system substrate-binding protein